MTQRKYLKVYLEKTSTPKLMYNMNEESRQTKDEEALQNGVHQQITGTENGNVLLVAHELAMAGDELTKQFSKKEVEQDTVWDNVKRYALIVTFRLLFGRGYEPKDLYII
jgi:hypothetical protein